MIKARKRFVFFALLCVFVLLFVLLGIINGVNFTMVGDDADQITQMLAQQQGMFSNQLPPAPEVQGVMPADAEIPFMNPPDAEAQTVQPPDFSAEGNAFRVFFPGMMGPMGPDAPDMAFSLRYFTFAFDQDGTAERVAWQITAVSEEDALVWARSLLKEKETGWTSTTYRYRVYQIGGKSYVTVIDQGRELLPSFRILLISGIGLVVGMLVSCFALMYIGKRLFKPLEEAERKQKRFIADAEKEFKVPLTIINANTEIIERQNGETEETLSINRQVKKMIGLVKDLSSLGVFDEKELALLRCDLSAIAQAAGDAMKSQFEEKGVSLKITAEHPVEITGDSEAMGDLMTELLNNALKFASSWVELKVQEEDGHSVIAVSNDTSLPAGSVDQVFDRFTRLENAADLPGAGLGLSHVKEIVQAHNGRAGARVADGVFTLRINL